MAVSVRTQYTKGRCAVLGKTIFRGGFQMCDGKELSKDKPIMEFSPNGDAVYPLSQHIGVPAKPVVAVGDRVLVGQRIAEANGVVSAHVISAVSGTVKAIEELLTASGALCESVVIENDGAFTTTEEFGTKRDFTKLSKEEIRQSIKDAGIVGMGGMGFPTHVKLTPKRDDAISHVIVNGTECEPYLTSDYRLMLEESEKLIEGLRIILQLFESAKGVILITDDKKEAIRRLSGLVKGEERITVKAVKAKYPQGAERQAIKAVTGRRINSSMLPADVGCVVHNVETVLAVYRAVAESVPLIHRTITVSGDGVKEPQNYQVRIGTSYEELFKAAGGSKEKTELLLAGSSMRGTVLSELTVPVTKNSSALLAFARKEAVNLPTSPCIRCGRCIAVCPGRLLPQKLMKYAEKKDKEGFIQRDGMECCECGACSYVCPAGRSLTQSFRQMRRSILDERRKR